MEIVILDIVTWIGTDYSAVHYYGKFSNSNRNRIIGYVTRKLTNADVIELNKYAARLGKEPQWSVGDVTESFLDRDKLVAQAISQFRSNIQNNNMVLLLGDRFTGEPKKIISASAAKVGAKVITELNGLHAEWEKLWHSRENDTECYKLSSKWRKRFAELLGVIP